MSTMRTHYIMLGVKFAFSDFSEEFRNDILSDYEDNGHTEKITEKDGITVISDGMNGEYIIIGKVLAKALEHDGLDLFQIPSNFDVKERTNLLAAIADLIKRDMSPEPLRKTRVTAATAPSYIVFTHWH